MYQHNVREVLVNVESDVVAPDTNNFEMSKRTGTLSVICHNTLFIKT